jgi:mannose-6-phosphate isomerase-like protein (cupin superfamily)
LKNKIWGTEEIVKIVGDKQIEKICLNKWCQTSHHHHKNTTEIIRIESGLVGVKFNHHHFIMEPGDILRINYGDSHCFAGIEYSVITKASLGNGGEEDEDNKDDIYFTEYARFCGEYDLKFWSSSFIKKMRAYLTYNNLKEETSADWYYKRRERENPRF